MDIYLLVYIFNADLHLQTASGNEIVCVYNSAGLGSSKKHADNWIAHQDDFNALLSQLNSGTQDNEDTETESAKVASLEERSKSAKGRVQYVSEIFYYYC